MLWVTAALHRAPLTPLHVVQTVHSPRTLTEIMLALHSRFRRLQFASRSDATPHVAAAQVTQIQLQVEDATH
jgi:streptomycin 6-kinase